ACFGASGAGPAHRSARRHALAGILSLYAINCKQTSVPGAAVAQAPSGEPQAEDIVAAALFFEYRLAGVRTRVFSTDDAVGFRSVIAAPDERARFAERAACALLKSGAHVVLATHETHDQSGPAPASVPGTLLGYRQRRVGRMLTLAPSYEETLARMGRLTRRNLRYYRRHLALRLRVEFVG